MGARAGHRGLRDRPRPAVGHGVRGRRRGDRDLAGPRAAARADRAPRRDEGSDNFWWTHAAGPGGPCSEIFVDRGAAVRPRRRPRRRRGPLHGDLEPRLHAGRGRRSTPRSSASSRRRTSTPGRASSAWRWLLQDVENFFETDLFAPAPGGRESLSGKHYGADERDDISIRRSSASTRAPRAFLVADGVQPSNEGRGYILRRMLRRVVSHARRLGIEGAVMAPLVAVRVERDSATRTRSSARTARSSRRSPRRRRSGSRRRCARGCSCSRRRAPRRARRAGRRRRRVQALRHVRVPARSSREELAADAGLDGRHGPVRRAARGAARACARRGRRRCRSASTPARCRPTEFVGYAAAGGRGRRSSRCSTRENRELEVAEEGQEVRVFLDAHPVLRGGRRSGRRPRQDPDRRPASCGSPDAQWAGPHAIMHAGRRRVRRGPRRARTRSARSTGCAARPPRAPTPRRTSCTGR